MRAELIAVGSELLQFGRHDTNGDWLALRLARMGMIISRRTIVADSEEQIAAAISESRSRSQLVVVTGGLGPTADDLTREGLARSLGVSLRTDPAIRDALLARIAARGWRALGSADSQARVPEGCETLPNTVGSAPGLLHKGTTCWTLVFPGVPGEMKPMFDAVLSRLREAMHLEPSPFSRFLIAGLSESEVDHAVRDLIGVARGACLTILATEGGVELLVAGAGAGAGEDRQASELEVRRVSDEIRVRLGNAISAEGDGSVASAVGALLERSGSTLVVAESCTGGLLGAAITAVPGSSRWFQGGFLVYSESLKRELLGIDAVLLRQEGAVSEPVARAMAEGARDRTSATHALAITGIAGPDGGTEAKPVGLVFVALAGPGETIVERLRLGGSRQTIRARSVTRALELLRGRLIGEGRC